MFKNIKSLIKYMDVLLIIVTAFLLIYNLTIILISLGQILSNLGLDINKNFITLMVKSSNNPIVSTHTALPGESHITNVKFMHNDGGWANSIRSIFIYGTGVLRLTLLRSGGSPTSRAFVIGSTIAAEAASKVLHNAINDPRYVKSHIESWRVLWKDNNPILRREECLPTTTTS
jgi:hypothetical protein